MCSHYEALNRGETYQKHFQVNGPKPMPEKLDMWPKYMGAFVRKPPETDPHDEAVPQREALNGRWGLVPWALKDSNTRPRKPTIIPFDITPRNDRFYP